MEYAARMRKLTTVALFGSLLVACTTTSPPANDPAALSIDVKEPAADGFLLSNARQLTYQGRRSKEAYFSPDGGRLVFQSEREPDNPFYQTHVLDLSSGRAVKVSPGVGRTTRGFFHPGGHQVLFDSTHDDAQAQAEQKEEFEERERGDPDRFVWEYDPDLDLYVVDLATRRTRRLTQTHGYDAEGAFSPDGRWIVFASNRAAFADDLDDEDRERLALDPAYFVDLYLMPSDASDIRRLTERAGYDGGPVFSPDGERITWRRFEPEDGTAELYTMARDGSDVRQLSALDQMSWAAFYHPSGDYLVFSSNRYGLGNYELYIIDSDGTSPPARVTQAGGYDGLPAFSPDGRRIAWTGRHANSMLSQVFVADWNDAEARRRLALGPGPTLRPVGPAQVRAERSSEPAPEPEPSEFDPGGIEDPTEKGWSGRHTFGITRSLSRSSLRPLIRTPLYLVTVPLDLVLLPVTAVVGFID